MRTCARSMRSLEKPTTERSTNSRAPGASGGCSRRDWPAIEGPVQEGAVGAGTGTIAFSWKGGIGTSSRRLPANLGGWTVGVLVQTNYGGVLQVAGVPIGQELGQYYLKDELSKASGDGSCIVVVATDAPISIGISNGSRIAASSESPEPVRR